MLQPNQMEKSLVNQRFILKVRNLTPETLEINNDLRKAVCWARAKQKRDREEQRKETEKIEQEKARVELDIKKTKSMKEYLQKLCSQLQKDFENLMSKAAEEKSAHILAVEAVSLKGIRDEKLKETE